MVPNCQRRVFHDLSMLLLRLDAIDAYISFEEGIPKRRTRNIENSMKTMKIGELL